MLPYVVKGSWIIRFFMFQFKRLHTQQVSNAIKKKKKKGKLSFVEYLKFKKKVDCLYFLCRIGYEVILGQQVIFKMLSVYPVIRTFLNMPL